MIPQILPNGRNSHHPKQCAATQVTLGIRVSGKDQMNERQESQQFHLPIAWESSNNYSCLFRIFQPRNLLTSVEHTECTFCAWVNTADSKSPLIMGIYIYMIKHNIVYHDLPWFIMIYHDLPWFTMIYHDLPINLMVMFQFANAWVDELPPQPQLWTLGIREPGFSTCIFMGDPPPKKFQYYIKWSLGCVWVWI